MSLAETAPVVTTTTAAEVEVEVAAGPPDSVGAVAAEDAGMDSRDSSSATISSSDARPLPSPSTVSGSSISLATSLSTSSPPTTSTSTTPPKDLTPVAAVAPLSPSLSVTMASPPLPPSNTAASSTDPSSIARTTTTSTTTSSSEQQDAGSLSSPNPFSRPTPSSLSPPFTPSTTSSLSTSTMVTIDKGHPIPTSNALAFSLKSRLSSSAPLSSLSSVTPTTIISPKPYPSYAPTSSASLSSSSISSSSISPKDSGRPTSYSNAYPALGSTSIKDIHIKSPVIPHQAMMSPPLPTSSSAAPGVKEEDVLSEGDDEEYDEYEEIEEYEKFNEGDFSDDDPGIPEEHDTEMVDVSAGSSSPPHDRHPSSDTIPSSNKRPHRLTTPGSPSTVASGDGPSSSPKLNPQQQNQQQQQQPTTNSTMSEPSGSPRSGKSSGVGLRKDSKGVVTATICANCGTTSTPLWRRASDGQTICNACGLYYKARNLTRPPWLKRNMGLKKGESVETDDAENETSTRASSTGHKETEAQDNSTAGPDPDTKNGVDAANAPAAEDKAKASDGSCPGEGECNGQGGTHTCSGCPSFNQQQQSSRQHLVCANCRTTTTPLWRRDSSGNTICNACGLYFKLHNVHRPVTMKRAVIKRRKRVNVPANSPPMIPQHVLQQQHHQQHHSHLQHQQRSQHPQHLQLQAHQQQLGHQPHHSHLPPHYSSRLQYPKPLQRARTPPMMVAPNGVDHDQDEGAAAKRRRIQNSNGSRTVPAPDDYIIPNRAGNGQPEWGRRRSISPIENIGSSDQRMHHANSQHHQGPGYSQHQSRTQERYSIGVHPGSGQYHSTPSMSMSRYPMHPPPPPRVQQPPPPPPMQQQQPVHHAPQHSRQAPLPPPQQAQQAQQQQHPHGHMHPSHPSHPHHAPQHHPHEQGSIGYQHHQMDEGMHHSSQSSSGWNKSLPGYATVASSLSNTRLSSTGIVHSTGPPPISPPIYPRYQQGGAPQLQPYHQSYRAPGPPQPNHEYHSSEAGQQHGAPPPTPPQSSHHYSNGTSPTPGASSSGYTTPYHHPMSSMVNGGHGEGHSERERAPSGGSGSGHLPPISLPHPSHQGHHQALPRPGEMAHPQEQGSHHSFGHRRQPSSPPIGMNGVAIGAPPPVVPPPGAPSSAEVLQQTRQDLQREVTHLSMLLGRAAAVLSGLDQALDPHHAVAASGSPPVPHSIRESGSPVGGGYAMHSGHSGHPGPASGDVKTNPALGTLMTLSSSGGPSHPGAQVRHDERDMMHMQHQQQQQQQQQQQHLVPQHSMAPQSQPQYSKQQPQQLHGPPPPLPQPTRYPQTHSYSSYPLPRRS